MNLAQNEWDKDLLNDIFDERDANLIQSIPINSDEADSWYWKNEKLGMYSVISAYKALQDDREEHDLSDNSGF